MQFTPFGSVWPANVIMSAEHPLTVLSTVVRAAAIILAAVWDVLCYDLFMRIIIGLAVCLCTLLGGCTVNAPADREWKDGFMHAVITSDMHLSVDPNIVNSVVPAMPYGRETVETIAAQVIDIHPDVFIMTGDNTNSGDLQDMRALKEILQTIKDAGIMIVLTTGNHDFNKCSPEQYWECFGELFEIRSMAPDSLSYTTDAGHVRIFAMDDNSFDGGATGTFSGGTMRWLKAELQDARSEGMTVLFVSHHNIISGPDGDSGVHYRIQNPDLKDLLRAYDVKLCLSGHQHGQAVKEEDGLYEIISSMPLAGAHQIGSLKIEERSAEYHTMPIQFERYGSQRLSDVMAEADRKERDNMKDIFADTLKKEGLSGERYDGVMNLITRFFQCYSDGSLPVQAVSMRNDPYYKDMISSLWDYNYGPWMEQVLENPPMNGNELQIEW